MKEAILQFFNDIWNLALAKHNQGIYNTVYLVLLLTLPLVVIFTSLLVCCHCCCCRRRADGTQCCCCCKGEATVTNLKAEKKKRKKNVHQNSEDLWISVKTDPLSSERLALTAV